MHPHQEIVPRAMYRARRLDQQEKLMLNELLLAGWTYKVSKKGHYFMWSPPFAGYRGWVKGWRVSIHSAYTWLELIRRSL